MTDINSLLNLAIQSMAIGFGLSFGVLGAAAYLKLMCKVLSWLTKSLSKKVTPFSPSASYNTYQHVSLLGKQWEVILQTADKVSITHTLRSLDTNKAECIVISSLNSDAVAAMRRRGDKEKETKFSSETDE